MVAIAGQPIPEHSLSADGVEVNGQWLLFADTAGDHRWHIRLSEVMAWHYEVGRGRLVIHTSTRSYVVDGAGHEDRFALTNDTDDQLNQALVATEGSNNKEQT